MQRPARKLFTNNQLPKDEVFDFVKQTEGHNLTSLFNNFIVSFPYYS